MNDITRSVLFLSILVFQGCSSPSSDESSLPRGQSGGGSRGFQQLQKSVLIPMCSECHGGPRPRAGLDVTSYSELMDSGYVMPGNAKRSELCVMVQQGRMPPTGKLSASQINAICNWIDAGAE